MSRLARTITISTALAATSLLVLAGPAAAHHVAGDDGCTTVGCVVDDALDDLGVTPPPIDGGPAVEDLSVSDAVDEACIPARVTVTIQDANFDIAPLVIEAPVDHCAPLEEGAHETETCVAQRARDLRARCR